MWTEIGLAGAQLRAASRCSSEGLYTVVLKGLKTYVGEKTVQTWSQELLTYFSVQICTVFFVFVFYNGTADKIRENFFWASFGPFFPPHGTLNP